MVSAYDRAFKKNTTYETPCICIVMKNIKVPISQLMICRPLSLSFDPTFMIDAHSAESRV